MEEIKIKAIKINENWFVETQKQVDRTYQETIDYGRTQFVNKIVKLEQKLAKYKENYECILKQRDDLTKNATEQIESLIDEKNKYKSLYQNEKDHTDTLKRIIKKIEEILQKEYKENVFSHYEYDLATAKNTIKKILNLLKEIK